MNWVVWLIIFIVVVILIIIIVIIAFGYRSNSSSQIPRITGNYQYCDNSSKYSAYPVNTCTGNTVCTEVIGVSYLYMCLSNNGESCTRNNSCASGLCTNGKCVVNPIKPITLPSNPVQNNLSFTQDISFESSQSFHIPTKVPLAKESFDDSSEISLESPSINTKSMEEDSDDSLDIEQILKSVKSSRKITYIPESKHTNYDFDEVNSGDSY
jgi:hypothetical protein